MDKAKPFKIPKREVWEAFKRVKANQGAAGVDGQSIADFEVDLRNNLCKLWNRMSSGSCFPPPVRRVDIPKADGGTRPLGIPTVVDRVAQDVARRFLEPILEPVFDPDSAASAVDGASGIRTTRPKLKKRQSSRGAALLRKLKDVLRRQQSQPVSRVVQLINPVRAAAG